MLIKPRDVLPIRPRLENLIIDNIVPGLGECPTRQVRGLTLSLTLIDRIHCGGKKPTLFDSTFLFLSYFLQLTPYSHTGSKYLLWL